MSEDETKRIPRDARHTVTGRDPAPGHETGPAPQPIEPSTGQHGDHWVLPASERAKGFIRPVRTRYTHTKCGTLTTMPQAIAETYARQPGHYGSTFCVRCRAYLPVGPDGEFVWDDGSKVGT